MSCLGSCICCQATRIVKDGQSGSPGEPRGVLLGGPNPTLIIASFAACVTGTRLALRVLYPFKPHNHPGRVGVGIPVSS